MGITPTKLPIMQFIAFCYFLWVKITNAVSIQYILYLSCENSYKTPRVLTSCIPTGFFTWIENGKSSGHHFGGGVYLSRNFCPNEHCSINGTNLSNCLWKQNDNIFQKLIIKTEK